MSGIPLNYIGDIHGNADALLSILDKMGYKKCMSTWSHPENVQIIFTGDYVDGGRQNLKVIKILRQLTESGIATTLMGNHDFNIVAMHTKKSNKSDKYLRPHNEKNVRQAKTTLDEFDRNPKQATEAIEFLRNMPLWLETDAYRAIHAFWDTEAMATLETCLNDNNSLTSRGFIKAAARSGSIGDARAQLLSGPEVPCKPYPDRFGIIRKMDRLKWWEENKTENSKPIFFGHYAMKAPLTIYNNAVCIDAGIAKGRDIAGYRFITGEALNPDNFIYAS